MASTGDHPGGGADGRVALAFLAVPLVGAADVLTGDTITLSILYLLTAIAATLLGGRRSGFAAVILSVVCGVFADILLAEPWLHLSIPIGDLPYVASEALTRGLVFTITVATISSLQRALAEKARLVAELREAAAEIVTLRGLLPLCAWCKRIRDEAHDEWKPLEQYVAENTDAAFTHGICTDCVAQLQG